MPSLSDVLSGFKRASNTTQARTGLSWKTEAVKPVNKTNAQAFDSFALACGIAPRNAGQQSPHTKKNNAKTKYVVYGKTVELTQSAIDYYNKIGVKITRVGSGSTGSPAQPVTPITNENYITRTKGEFEHDLDQYGYDPLYGQRDFQSDVDIWTHINEIIHPKHKEQQEYIDIKDEALFSGIQGIYQTRRSKKDIEKIIHDYYQDDIDRIEGKSHQHGFDPLGDLVKNLTIILIIAGVAYVGYKSLPLLRKLI